MMKRTLLILCLTFWVNTFSANIYVDQSAPTGGDGSSWASAFQDIQSAVDAASANDIILIAAGIYQPVDEIDIIIPLTIRGGYPQGGGTQDIDTNITQIQADFNPANLLFTIFDIKPNAQFYIEGTRFFQTRRAITTYADISINNVQFNESSIADLWLSDDIDFCTVTNSTFSDCTGSSLYLFSNQVNNLLVDNCVFQNGTGRALFIHDEVLNTTFTNSIIRNYNSTTTIATLASPNTTINKLTIDNNSSSDVIQIEGINTSINNLTATNNSCTSRILFHFEGTAIITNSTFNNNLGTGECIQTTQNCYLTLENVDFIDNTITDSPIIRGNGEAFFANNCKFINNETSGTFSTIVDLRGDDGADIGFDNCEVKNNRSGWGSTFDISYDADVVINNCVFENNGQSGEGDLDFWTLKSAEITNNRFDSNTSTEPVIKIGLMMVDNALIRNNTFLNNTGSEVEADRIDDLTLSYNVYYGNSIFLDIDRVPIARLNNEYFEGNNTNSEFIRFDETTARINNMTMISTLPSGNHTLIESVNDVALRILNSTISAKNYTDTNVRVDFDNDVPSWIRNSIIWSGNDLSQSAFSGSTTNLTVRNSLIKGEDPPGAGNLDGTQNANRPRFSDPSDSDFRVIACSPTVNAGNNTYQNLNQDLLGNARVFETTVDMGAYEIQIPESASCAALDRPLCTNLLTPSDGSTNVDIATNLEWSADPDAVGYILRVGSALGLSDILDITLANETSYNLSEDLPPNTEIFVRIVPFNGTGNALSCSSESFTTQTVPNCTSLTSPANGSIDVSVDTNISWSPVANATGYIIRIGSALGSFDLVNTVVGTVDTYDLPNDLRDDSEIFVRIVPFNTIGNANGCSSESFTTETLAIRPNCTTLTLPLDGDTDVSIATNLTWTPDPNATGYILRVGTALGSFDLLNETLAAVNTYNLPADLPENTEIFVRIVPFSDAGNALTCVSESFTTETLVNTNAFITTWKTDNPGVSNDNQITIPTFGGGYNYTVDWGDGNITTGEIGNATHTYATVGTYTVSITGDFPRIRFNNGFDKDKILTIEQWGDNPWTTMESAFYGCANLNITNPTIDEPNLTNLTELGRMFEDCTSFNGDVTNWDVSTVETMTSLFRGATIFNRDIGNWDVSNVQNLSRTFSDAIAFNQDISGWDVSNVTSLLLTFWNAESFNQPIQSWDVSKVVTFARCLEETDVFNQPIGVWDTSSATNISGVFQEAVAFNQDLSNWDVSNVTLFRNTFEGAILFNQDISGWDTSSATDMLFMFKDATAFNQDISSWDVSQVFRMFAMFENATAFDQDLSAWNVESVTTAERMFNGITLSTSNYDALLIGWNAQNLQPNVIFSGGNSQYCLAEPDRTNMINTDLWTITDGGSASNNNATLDAVANVTIPNTYTLPVISGSNLTGNERYYTDPNGNGVEYNAGDSIIFADFPSYPITLYIFDTSATCNTSEISFELTITESTVPDCTNLTTPLDGSTDISIATDLTWTALTNADGYFVTVGTTSGGTDILDNFDVANNNTYDLPADLPENTEIFVSIIPYNGAGNATGCTEKSFTTVDNTPVINDLYVDLSAPPGGNGLTWATAFQYIESAVAIATADDTIFIAEGIYKPQAEMDIDFPLNIRGAYPAGGGIQDFAFNITQIQADFNPSNILARIFDIGVNSEFSIEGVRFFETVSSIETSSNIIIDHVSFEQTTQIDLRVADDIDSVLISNSLFSGNTNTSISVTNDVVTNFTIDNSTFQNGQGSAAFLSDDVVNFIMNNTIIEGYNTTNSIFNLRSLNSVFTNVIAQNNTLGSSSIINLFNATLSISASNFINNNATGTVSITSNNSSVILDNSNFNNNSASGSFATGVFDVRNSQLTATNCQFNNNTTDGSQPNGVGTGNGDTVVVSFDNCEFINNTAVGSIDYGLFKFFTQCTLIATNSIFDGNEGGYGSAINMFNFDELTLENNIFRNHNNGGPVVDVYNAAASIITLNDNIFENNSATDVNIGQAASYTSNRNTFNGPDVSVILNGIPTVNLAYDYFKGNTDLSEFLYLNGTEVDMNHIVMISESTTGTHDLIRLGNNVAQRIVNSTFSSTSIDDTHVRIRFDNGQPSTFDNSILWSGNNNLTESALAGSTVDLTIRHSVVKGENPAGVGNLDGTLNDNRPRFVNPSSLDFRELTCSPTVNAGNNAYTTEVFDYLNNPRVFETTVDIGAYELQELATATCDPPTVPNCVSLINPLDGALDIAISTDLSWMSVPNAIGYFLTVGTTSGGNDILDNENVTGTTFNLPTDLPENTEIFVTIIPYNGVGNATGCTEESFTTETLATVPNCTALTTPLNGATNVSITTDLSWTAIANADGYFITVGTTSGGNDILDNEDITGTTFDLPTDLPENTEIFVTIVPYNGVGNATGCLEESFTTETLATIPNCTTLSIPLNGSTDVSILTDLTWTAIANADGYFVTVGTTSGGNDILDNEDVTGTTFDLPTDLPENTEIFVTIIPYNGVGNAVDCNEARFTTETLVVALEPDNTKYGFSPDGDGVNEYWEINTIENYPDNTVTIYNRWGDIVFTIKGYNNTTNVFRGIANRKTKMGAGILPSGTYFFDIQINGNHNLKKTRGFVVLKR